MTHVFDIEHAKLYGIEEAIFIANMQFWILKNRANGKHKHEERTWTYNSARALGELFPYMTPKTIRNTIQSLVDQKIIMTGNYNETAYDRTLWYAFVDESTFLNGKMDLPKRENGFAEKGEPIPDSKPNVNKDKDIKNTAPDKSVAINEKPLDSFGLLKSQTREALKLVNPSAFEVNPPKENKQLIELCKTITRIAPEQPLLAMGKIFLAYKEQKATGNNFWKTSPWTASALVSRLTQLWEIVTKRQREEAEAGKVDYSEIRF